MNEAVTLTESALVERVSPKAPKVAIRNLDFHYGAFQALKHVNFDVL